MRKKIKTQTLTELSLMGNLPQPGFCEILRNILTSAGVHHSEIVECHQDGRQGVLTYFSVGEKARTLKAKIEGLSLKNIKINLTTLTRPQWEEKWKRDFAPFALTSRLDVVPVWRKKDYCPNPSRESILIDTISAFGTGLHDTTRFMANLIERCTGRFKSFLDIGTGTGILSLVARKCQAAVICAIDIDAECIKVAKVNMATNGYGFNRIAAIDLRRYKNKHQFDFVAANLISFDLIRLKRKIVSLVKPGQFLAVSGISLENLSNLKKEFRNLPLRCEKIEQSKHWAALLFKKMH